MSKTTHVPTTQTRTLLGTGGTGVVWQGPLLTSATLWTGCEFTVNKLNHAQYENKTVCWCSALHSGLRKPQPSQMWRKPSRNQTRDQWGPRTEEDLPMMRLGKRIDFQKRINLFGRPDLVFQKRAPTTQIGLVIRWRQPQRTDASSIELKERSRWKC